MGKTSFSAVVALALVATACGGDPDHPSNLSFDGGSGSGGGGSGGSSGSGGSGGSGGTACEPNPNEGSKLSGDLIIYDVLFDGEYAGFVGQAEILAEGYPCGWAKTTYDGAAPPPGDGGKNFFLLEGVKAFTQTWVRFYEAPTSFEPVYATLLPVNTTSDLHLEGQYGFIRSTDIQKVYADTATTPDAEKATVVVQLIDQFSGTPLAGGKVATGVNSVVAYPFGGGWQSGNGSTLTDPSGVAVFMNVDATPFPGTSTVVNVTYNGSIESHNIVVERGAVTVIWIGVGFQT